MCIIAVKKANQSIPDGEIMETMFKNNSDGAGFCYCLNGEVIIKKGYMTYEDFADALKDVSEQIDTYASPMIFHFRIATHGGINPGLCHPFPMSKKTSDMKQLITFTKLAIIHNGIIDIKTRKDASDTMTYIAERLARRYKHDKKFYKNRKQRKLIQSEIGSSKLAFLDEKGEICTIGDFIEDNGILYSNSSYRERAFSFSFWDDCTDFTKLMPLDEGYIVTEKDIIECEEEIFLIGRGGKVYQYDYYFDVAVEFEGVAYNAYGFPEKYDEDKAVWINVLK